MSRIAYPFLILDHQSVDATLWETGDLNNPVALTKVLEDWDYQKNIRVFRQITINPVIASEQLGIPIEDLELRIFVKIGTGPGALPRKWIRALEIYPSDDSMSRYFIDLDITGSELSQRLRIDTLILTGAVPSSRGSLSPNLVSARVWSQETDIIIEGDEPRFPMATASFSQHFPGKQYSSALWYLHWNPKSIRDDFGSVVRLYINSDNEPFMERFTSADPLTLQSVMTGIIGQMITSFLMMPDADELISECEEESIGGYIRYWIRMAFPDTGLDTMRTMITYRPAEFHARISAAAEIEGFES